MICVDRHFTNRLLRPILLSKIGTYNNSAWRSLVSGSFVNSMRIEIMKRDMCMEIK